MKILILAAMDKELILLSQILTNPSHEQKNNVYRGEIGAHEIIITKCGIGKVNSALNCNDLIREFKPDLVINSGVAGGAGTPIGTVLIADSVAYDDVWCGPGTEYGQADGYPLFMKPSHYFLEKSHRLSCNQTFEYGLICSGDKFISTSEEIRFIREKFPKVKAVDMESAAIAQTCIRNNTEFAIVRVISDTPGEGENIEQYKDFWIQAPLKIFSLLESIISIL